MRKGYKKLGLRSLVPVLAVFMATTAYADVKRVTGEKCPSGYRHVTYQEVANNRQAYCGKLQQWDIARIAGGGSTDGPGYQCKVRQKDSRPLGHSLCITAAVQKSLNQAAYVNGTSEYRFGHNNSIPNMKIHGAPADTGYGRVAMLHDGSTYRLYLFKRGSRDTIYQFGFNRATSRYEYGYNSIKVLKIVGMPADAGMKGFAMLHDGKDYRLYLRSKDGKKLYQAAYKAGTNSYIYGHNSIKVMNITGAPADITYNGRWAMLHDGKDYRLYIGRKNRLNQFYQFAFDGRGYKHGHRSIPLLTVKNMPNTSQRASFAMLHDRSAYRFYFKTK